MFLRNLKKSVAVSLANAAYSPIRLVMIHSGIALGAAVLVNLLAFILDRMIANTGGLGDLGTRTVLASIRTVAQLTVQLLLPFWTMGFTRCSLLFARQASLGPKDLLEGLRRWGVTLRLTLAQALVTMLLALLASQVASTVFLLTPLSAGYIQAAQALPGDLMEITPEIAQSLLPSIVPMLVIMALLFIGLSIPVSYRLRMATLRIMDDDRPGAIRAMLQSNRMMKRRCLSLFCLDLSFWWYYAASLALNVLLWLPELLDALGVSVPMNGDVFYLLCYCLYAAAAFGLYYLVQAPVQTAYAAFHDGALAPFLPKTADHG